MILDTCIFALAQPSRRGILACVQSKTAGQPARGVQKGAGPPFLETPRPGIRVVFPAPFFMERT